MSFSYEKMKHYKILMVFFFCMASDGFGQIIKVVNKVDSEPVADAFIYHKNQKYNTITDAEGIANIAHFPKGTIFIQHASYSTITRTYEGKNLTIFLQESLTRFNDVVVSVNKWKQNILDIPQQITSINKKHIQFYNPQTSADILSSSGQVFVQKSQYGGGSPKLRGFSANSVLLVIDGIRMNNAIFRGGNLQNIINIDVHAVENTEVIFGPGTVIYGSDALGGVMVFNTINPLWNTSEKTHIKSNALLRYSSAANEQTIHMDASVTKQNFVFFHSTSFSRFGDLKAGNKRTKKYLGEFERNFYVERIGEQDQLIKNSNVNLQKFSGYNLFNTINKAKFLINDNLEIGYSNYYSTTSNIPRYDLLTETIHENSDSLSNAEWYYGPQKWTMHNVQADFYRITSLFDKVKFSAAYQHFEESRNDRKFGNNSFRNRTEQVNVYSLSIDADKAFNTNKYLYYGLDIYHNKVISSAFRKDILTQEITTTDSRYPDGGSHYTTFALYGNYVFPAFKRSKINIGGRLNAVNLNAKTTNREAKILNQNEINLTSFSFNGAAGFVYHSKKNEKLNFTISTGFRAPNVDDIGKVFDINENVIIVPNPNIKPEYTINKEVSFSKKKNRFNVSFTLFHSRLINAIVRDSFNINGIQKLNGKQIMAQVNTNQAVIYGTSLLFEIQAGNDWTFFNTISFVDGKNLDNQEPLRHTTPVFGQSNIQFNKKKWTASFYIEFNGNRWRNNIPSTEIDAKPYLYTEDGTPGWLTLNTKVNYEISKQINFNLGIENVLNKHYRPYSSGISAPGRNFILSLRLSI